MGRKSKKVVALLLALLMVFSVCSPVSGGTGLDLITGNRNKKFFGIGLDVYEEETNNVFENREDDILESSITARLLSFPNVIVTSHQGFLTEEALEAISRTTLDNARDYENGTIKDINAV